MRLGVSQVLVGGRIVDGDVTVEDGRVASVGVAPAGASGLAANGVTAFQPTLISLPSADYLTTLRRAGTMSISSARIIGIHLEGRFSLRSPVEHTTRRTWSTPTQSS